MTEIDYSKLPESKEPTVAEVAAMAEYVKTGCIPIDYLEAIVEPVDKGICPFVNTPLPKIPVNPNRRDRR